MTSVARWKFVAILLIGGIAAGALVAYRTGILVPTPPSPLTDGSAGHGSRPAATIADGSAGAPSDSRSQIATQQPSDAGLNGAVSAGVLPAISNSNAGSSDGVAMASAAGALPAGGEAFAGGNFAASSGIDVASTAYGNSMPPASNAGVLGGGAFAGASGLPGRSYTTGGASGLATSPTLPVGASGPVSPSSGDPAPAGGGAVGPDRASLVQPAGAMPQSDPGVPVAALAPAAVMPGESASSPSSTGQPAAAGPPASVAPPSASGPPLTVPPAGSDPPVTTNGSPATGTLPSSASGPVPEVTSKLAQSPAQVPVPSNGTSGTAPSTAAANPGPVIVAAAPLPSDPRDFVQTGGKTVIDTVLSADAVDILGGRLGGHGLIQAETVTIGPGGILGPGNSPGILTIDSGLVLSGELEIEIAGTKNLVGQAPQYDVLHVTGSVTFTPGSTVKFVFYPIYSPTSGDEWEFLTAGSLVDLDYLTFSTAGLADTFDYQVYAEGSDLHLRIFSHSLGLGPTDAGEIIVYEGSAVPAPSTLALGLLGLMLLGWRARRRAIARSQ